MDGRDPTDFESPGRYRLEIPLDASGVKDFHAGKAVKILAFDRQGRAYETTVRFDAGGSATATLHFQEAPGDLRLAAGPPNAPQGKLAGFQTLCVAVSAGDWGASRSVRLPPVVVSGRYLWWWLSTPLVRADPFLD